MKFSLQLFTKLAVLGSAIALLPYTLPARSQSNPQVIASHSVLCDLTQQIAQDTVDVVCLIKAGEDPHTYNATPTDRRAIESADLVLYSGYEFEPDIIQMVEASNSDTPSVAVAEMAVSDPLLGAHHHHDHAAHSDEHSDDDHDEDEHDHSGHKEDGHEDEHDEHDHSDHEDEDHKDEHGEDGHGEDEHEEEGHDEHDHEEEHEEEGHDEHDHEDHDDDEHGEEDHDDEEGEPDPHVWHDAENGVAMVSVIQAQLSEAFPSNADLYQENAQTLTTQLTQLDSWIQTQINTVPSSQRVLVSTHDALGYYADAYGLRIETALVSFSTEVRPSAADLRELIDVVEESDLPSIFVETTSNPGLIEAVSRETDIAVSEQPLYADSLGEANTPAATYQGMLMTNTCTIVEGLGGRCDASSAQAMLN